MSCSKSLLVFGGLLQQFREFDTCGIEGKVQNASGFYIFLYNYLEILSVAAKITVPFTGADESKVLQKTDLKSRVDVLRCIRGRIGGIFSRRG